MEYPKNSEIFYHAVDFESGEQIGRADIQVISFSVYPFRFHRWRTTVKYVGKEYHDVDWFDEAIAMQETTEHTEISDREAIYRAALHLADLVSKLSYTTGE